MPAEKSPAVSRETIVPIILLEVAFIDHVVDVVPSKSLPEIKFPRLSVPIVPARIDMSLVPSKNTSLILLGFSNLVARDDFPSKFPINDLSDLKLIPIFKLLNPEIGVVEFKEKAVLELTATTLLSINNSTIGIELLLVSNTVLVLQRVGPNPSADSGPIKFQTLS